MKSSLVLSTLLGAQVYGHYYFPHLIINGTETPKFKYVRDVTTPPGYDGEWNKGQPQDDLTSPDLTCGRSAFLSARKTEVADVLAGSEIGFHMEHDRDNDPNWNNYIFHGGPAQAYLAKLPDDVDFPSFSGIDADWFKIASITAARDTKPNANDWIAFRQTSVNFTLPPLLPAGKYLLRFEHIHLTRPAEFYVNCAQINVLRPQGSTEAPGYIYEDQTVKIPGVYKKGDPRLELDYAVWNQPGALLYYVGPGPKVWTGK